MTQMISEKVISFYGTTEDQLVDRIAEKLSSHFQALAPAIAIDEKKPLSIDEASQFTGLAKQTIYKGTSEGTFPHHKQGGKLFFFRDELIDWIKGQSRASKIHLR